MLHHIRSEKGPLCGSRAWTNASHYYGRTPCPECETIAMQHSKEKEEPVMPCHTDPDPWWFEEIDKVYKNLEYLHRKLGKGVPPKKQTEAALDEYTKILCETMNSLGLGGRDKMLYTNARDVGARKLANWWEKHEKADAKHKAQEAAKSRKRDLALMAKTKLTKEELEALKKALREGE